MTSRTSLTSCIPFLATVVFLGQPITLQAKDLSSEIESPHLRGLETAEAAAITMVRAYAAQDFSLFMQARALFECEEEQRGGPNRYAESLYHSKFYNGDVGHTVYDLPTRLNADTARVTAKRTPKLKFIDSATISDKVPHQKLMFVDVSIQGHDKRNHRIRIVVIEFARRWYAVPKGYNSKQIYALADSAGSLVAERAD